ncbi:serpin A3-5 isoform X2 [Tupaia chinensis]|nr:serpin A3-5 isoform X2 [Tupaia chinensis]XP_006165445.1 serpin A3-5 isoform X2 [Tupaia chinensis]XP_006165446.1 serpin A3-5 isoform X2 [Tupaia chinensis]XP_006165447.1 serpin A3-5 isoform X2 [Tupaia chinensis]XP_006165448.1 serpin A3-5 isoform X2 [Tupaia chinensis]
MANPTLSFWLLVAGLCPHTYYSQEYPPAPEMPSASSTALNNSHFAFRLYREMVAANPGRNVLFSPLSVSIPLTLLALKAKPAVCSQILKALGFSLAEVANDQAQVHYSQLLRALLPDPWKCPTEMGSVLFVDKRRSLVRKFIDTAQNLYRMDVFLTAFKSYATARDYMDFFIRKKTHGKIEKLTQKVNPDTVLILANYIFFKGKWKHYFDPKLTEMRPFSVNEKLTVQVPMMHRLGYFQLQYFRHLHSYVLWLPCRCNANTVFILPNMGKVSETEEALLKENFDTWTQPLTLSKRRLYLPKFSLRANVQLDQFTPTTGISDIFSYSAGLTGISLQTLPMRVSKAVHVAELTVDEDGAEKEDITGLRFSPSHLIPILDFNRPFLLLVFAEGSHNLLFMGKVMNPKANLSSGDKRAFP